MENNQVNESWVELLEEVLKDVRVITHFKEQEQLKVTKTEELITINEAGYDFDTLGIPFNALVVGEKDEGTVVHIEYKGMFYDITLEAGVNQVNFLNGMNLKTKKGIVVGLVRTQNALK